LSKAVRQENFPKLGEGRAGELLSVPIDQRARGSIALSQIGIFLRTIAILVYKSSSAGQDGW
ncbi:uncharacterized protein PpBr36_05862, partial [Pyricularia pennisetigena]|uniref:uncharacterized protein n=1 Tax=Pyricularia pennisetigena TaxID=1578925 RepID=UPI001150716B